MKKFDSNIGYDEDLGRILWEEFLAEYDYLKFYGHNKMEYLVLFAKGEMKKAAFNRNELEEKDFDELLELAESFDLHTNGADEEDLINELMFVTKEQYYYNLYHDTIYFDDLEYDFVARGYSQGDAVAVNLVGDVEVSKEQIEHLLYDSPIYGQLTVYESETKEREDLSDVEWVEVGQIYLDEYLSDPYSWDKDQFLTNFTEQFGGKDKEAILRFLEQELPEKLSY